MKAAIVILADTETKESLGRAVNALTAAKEFKDAGDEVRVIFDGAGVKWPAAFAKPDQKYRELFESVRDKVTGVCEYCAGAVGVADRIREAEVPFAGEHDGHPSFRQLVRDGFQIITF